MTAKTMIKIRVCDDGKEAFQQVIGEFIPGTELFAITNALDPNDSRFKIGWTVTHVPSGFSTGLDHMTKKLAIRAGTEFWNRMTDECREAFKAKRMNFSRRGKHHYLAKFLQQLCKEISDSIIVP